MDVLIRHPDGREYEIPEDAFAGTGAVRGDDGTLVTYANAGFAIIRWADGRPYEQPDAGDDQPARSGGRKGAV